MKAYLYDDKGVCHITMGNVHSMRRPHKEVGLCMHLFRSVRVESERPHRGGICHGCLFREEQQELGRTEECAGTPRQTDRTGAQIDVQGQGGTNLPGR